MLIAKCPKDAGHQTFITTAHVVEEWRVDARGNYIETVESVDTTHRPDSRNIWTCAVCGATAVVRDINDDDERHAPRNPIIVRDDTPEVFRVIFDADFEWRNPEKWKTLIQTTLEPFIYTVATRARLNVAESMMKRIQDRAIAEGDFVRRPVLNDVESEEE